MSNEGLMVFTSDINPKLAKAVVEHLGVPLGEVLVGWFSDGEVQVEVQESVRGRHVFILQSTCAPTNDNLMELMVMADVLKRASTRRITVVIPYFGYTRQGRHPRSVRVAVATKVVTNMLRVIGVKCVLTMDFRVDQIRGFLDTPVDNIYALSTLFEDLRKRNYEDLPVVLPDVDDVVHTYALTKQLGVDLAIIDKCRPKANAVEVVNIIDEVDGRNCVIVDDMIDTGGTLYKVVQVLEERGARQAFSYYAHSVLSGGAAARIADSTFDEVIMTNTIPLREDAVKYGKVRQLSTAPLLAETFTRIMRDDPIVSLFAE